MDEAEQKELVRARYGGIATAANQTGVNEAASGCCVPPAAASACCGPAGTPGVDTPGADKPGADEKALRMGYSVTEIAAVPDGANLGLGCGNPQAIAALRPGEIVVDLGSGAGFDCLLAAGQVGPEGRVIGVDMTHEMLKKARDNALTLGAENVEFRLGEIEHLPIPDNTADVVISNCVINLVPDKAQVYREAFRVLRPGGRFAVSDVVNIAALPPDLAADPTLLCGCIAGAVPEGQVQAWLAASGFVDIRIDVKPGSRDLIAGWAPGTGVENHVASAAITARKPAA